MDELSTSPIPEPFRAGEQRQLGSHVSRRPLQKRFVEQNRQSEANEPDEPVENHTPEHQVDISV